MRAETAGANRDDLWNSQLEQPFAAPGRTETAPSSPTDWDPRISCRDDEIIDGNESDPKPRRNRAGQGFIRTEDRSTESVWAIIDPSDRFLVIFHSKNGSHRREDIVVKESAIW